MTLQIHIPYPPSANRLWVRAKKGMRKSDEYAHWLTEAGWMVKAQKPGRIEGPYKITINAQRPDKRKRDLSNLLKATEDMLQSAGVIRDDCECESIVMQWMNLGGNMIQVLLDPMSAKQ